MEEQDLSKILLTDSEFYVGRALYAQFLKRHNITTVEELLNGKLERLSFNGHMMKGRTFGSLSSFIRLLKHKYCDGPLLVDSYLENSIDMEKTRMSSHGIIYLKDSSDVNIVSFFGSDISDLAFSKFIEQCRDKNEKRKNENLPEDEVKIIDFFKWIEKQEITGLMPFAKVYIEAYEKNNKLSEVDASTMAFLKGQLESLIKMKSDIDGQIIELQQKIEEISNSKGGMSV